MVGKGRAPCCDKNKVKRGPWSPAEDLRLITFIQKNGHDNWRALPKQAGLLRCGKSCRLRWINYLRPDVKRGNFSKEEEETIIQLHQSLGNKWSKIASHFPGRTDNEIKNVWNTHLKKRLSSKNTNPSEDESKESSITTSSSSSSTDSILSSKKRNGGEVLVGEESVPKRPFNDNHLTSGEKFGNIQAQNGDDRVGKEVTNNDFSLQLAKNPKEWNVSTTTSSASSYGSDVSNGTISTIRVDDVSRLGDHEEELLMDNLLFDFKEPCDVGDILQEVNKPDNVEEKAVVLDQTLMQLEADYDFWNVLDSFDTFFYQPINDIGQVQVLENSELCQNSNPIEQQNKEIDENEKWLRYLESELGLEATTGSENANQQVIDENRANGEGLVPVEGNFRSAFEMKPESDPTCLEFSTSFNQLWPSNNLPQNSPAF